MCTNLIARKASKIRMEPPYFVYCKKTILFALLCRKKGNIIDVNQTSVNRCFTVTFTTIKRNEVKFSY